MGHILFPETFRIGCVTLEIEGSLGQAAKGKGVTRRIHRDHVLTIES